MPRIDLPPGDEDEVVRLYLLSPEMGAAAGRFSDVIYQRSALPPREREIARMRIAAINGCPVCLETRMTSTDDHRRGVRRLGARQGCLNLQRLRTTRRGACSRGDTEPPAGGSA